MVDLTSWRQENRRIKRPSAEERQEAELEFVAVAYSNEEAWVSTTIRQRQKRNSKDDKSSGNHTNKPGGREIKSRHNCVHRRLDLPIFTSEPILSSRGYEKGITICKLLIYLIFGRFFFP